MDYSKQANQRKRLQKEVDQQRLVSKIWLNILRIACILVLAAVFIVGDLHFCTPCRGDNRSDSRTHAARCRGHRGLPLLPA